MNITDITTYKQLIQADKTILMLSATWCGPCKRIKPYFLELAQQPHYADINFGIILVDKAPELADQLDYTYLPTFQLWSRGQQVGKLEGANQQKLQDQLTKLV